MKDAWRSIKFPEDLANQIQKIAKKEKRSFSAQALMFIEAALSERESIHSGSSQLDINAIEGNRD